MEETLKEFPYKANDRVQLTATVESVDTGEPDGWIHLNCFGTRFSLRASQLPDPETVSVEIDGTTGDAKKTTKKLKEE